MNERLLKSLESEFNKIKDKQPKDIEELDLTDIVSFTEKYVSLPERAEQLGNKTWFELRPWLNELYRDNTQRQIIVKGKTDGNI